MKQYSLEARLAAFVAEHLAAQAPSRLLAAVSGGADSMALLVGLARLREEMPGFDGLHVGHINHQLRGEESEGDAAFVAEQAGKLGVDCTVMTANVAAIMAEGGQSLETTARDVRYRLLADIARKMDCTAIALAHTADDQAETVLHRILRGTGLRGLAGMAPRREHDGLMIFRPLLAVSRGEVEDYLAGLAVPYRHDGSNDSLDYTRNRLRHELLPLLRANYNPHINDALLQLAAIARDAQEYVAADTGKLLDSLIQDAAPQRLRCYRHKLAALPRIQQVQVLQECMERLGIRERDVDFGHITTALNLIAGETPTDHSCNWPGHWRLIRKDDEVILQHCPPAALTAVTSLGEVGLTIPGSTPLPPGFIVFDAATKQILPPTSMWVECRDRAEVRDEAIFANPDVRAAWLDAEAVVGGRLFVRTRREGDRFQALGAPGGKTLGDVLTDRKAPAAGRDRLALVGDGQGIVWLCGVTIAERVKVTAKTTRLLRLSIKL